MCMYRKLMALIALLMLFNPVRALAAHEVKDRRTDYGGHIFVGSWHPIGHRMVSWHMATLVRRAYHECLAADPDQNCRITYEYLPLVDKTAWEKTDSGTVRITTQVERDMWARWLPKNIAGISGSTKGYAFLNTFTIPGRDPSMSIARWVAQEEGLQTRHGVVFWVGPASAFDIMEPRFRCSSKCANPNTVSVP